MKKLFVFICVYIILISCCYAVAEHSFDLSAFQQEQSIAHPDENMWNIVVDDIEYKGFIVLNNVKEGYVAYWNDTTDTFVGVTPDVFLKNYNTDSFQPIPRIWLDLYYPIKKGYVLVDSVVFRIGDTPYIFKYGSTKVESAGRSLTEEKYYCVCDNIQFMDAWIENTDEIKFRMKGDSTSYDFTVPEISRQNIAAMFRNFKDAGGYAYYENVIIPYCESN